MDFCRNCGTKLIKDHQFCAECGEPIKINQSNPVNQPETISQTGTKPIQDNFVQTPSLPKQPFFKSKKSKILTVIGAFIIALLAGGYYFVSEMTSPSAVAEDFIEAINEKDAAIMKKYINDGQYEMKTSDKEAKEFIAYLHEHPRMITSIAEGLLSDAAAYEDDQSNAQVGESSPYASMKNKGKKWVLFESYTIQVQTFYVDVSSEIEKTDIYLNGEKQTTIDDEKTIGPLLPGEYKVKGMVNGEYGKVEDEQTIDTSDTEDQTLSLQFDWNDYYVDVYSNYDDAVLYVNDKSTKKEVGEINQFGPVPLDGSVKVFAQKKFDEGMKKSKVVTLKKGTTDAELIIEFEEVENEEVYAESIDDVDGTDDTEAIKDSILAHYNYISQDDFTSAYQLFSSSRKSKVTMDGWTKGLKQNIKDTVTDLEIVSIENSSAKAYIKMISYDEKEDGSILVQEWGGNWNLVKENDGWKLDKAELEKLATRTE